MMTDLRDAGLARTEGGKMWSSVALRSRRYAGKPHEVHTGLGLSHTHFQRWLALFKATAPEVCSTSAAAFIERAGRSADSLQVGLNIGPKALNLPDAVRRGLP